MKPTIKTTEYRKKWQKAHDLIVDAHKLIYYYRRSKIINFGFSRPDNYEEKPK